jgi:hypothetical protein
MVLTRIAAVVCLLMLGGCSYSYDILAKMIDGRLTFVVSPNSFRKPASCLTMVMVAQDPQSDGQTGPNGEGEVGHEGIVWWDEVGRECSTRFPVTYGVRLAGSPRSLEAAARQIDAKPLRPGIIYEVHITSGSTGYGVGRFRLVPNGGVENIPQ